MILHHVIRLISLTEQQHFAYNAFVSPIRRGMLANKNHKKEGEQTPPE